MKIRSKCLRHEGVTQSKMGPSLTEMDRSVSRYLRESQPDLATVRIVRATDGGALRTFAGGLMHENGWFASRKARRLLHWEGSAQREFLVRAEVEFSVLRMASEAVRFEFVGRRGWESYTCDVELVGCDGAITIVEIKRNERDLADPDYQEKLGAVKAICDHNGMSFCVVFRHQIFESIVHRRNVVHFADRGFVSISEAQLRRFDNHVEKGGRHSTFGGLAEAIEPTSRRQGEAIVQALTVARRVEIDLRNPVFDDTPVTLH